MVNRKAEGKNTMDSHQEKSCAHFNQFATA